MKMRAIDSFASAETGMVHAGDEFEIASETRAKEFAERGLAKAIPAAPQNKMEPAPENKGESRKYSPDEIEKTFSVPANRADPLDHDGDGRKGGAAKPRPARKTRKKG